jgi:FkbM family methyltransferase
MRKKISWNFFRLSITILAFITLAENMLHAPLKRFLAVLVIYNLHAHDPSFKFEGVLGNATETIQNLNSNAQAFIPYNPVIVEIGAFEGAGTVSLGSIYPYGTIFAFEPHLLAYAHLVEKTRSFKNVSVIQLAVSTWKGTATLYGNGSRASLVPQKGESQVDVSAVVLDDWCRQHSIDHIDFLRLDAGGLEWQIVESSPQILKEVIVIVTKTYMNSPHSSILPYPLLKKRLENEGFELLSHWYQEGKEGEATFIRKYMYDSLFR